MLNSCKMQQKSSSYLAAHLVLTTAQFEMLPFPPLASISLLYKVTLTFSKDFFFIIALSYNSYIYDIILFFCCLALFVYSIGFLGISNENAFFQKCNAPGISWISRGTKQVITPDILPPLYQYEANVNLNFSFIN